MTEVFLKLALVGDVWVLYLLIAASVVSLAVMIDRWRFFHKNRIKDIAGLMNQLERILEEGHNKAAALDQVSDLQSVEGRVAAAGIKNLSRGAAAVEEVMAAQLIQERIKMEKNLIVLGTLGNNAPFLGLFGTVLGIIKAFNDLAASGGSSASVVMAGISSALIATAFGILVAIPAVVANNYFVSRTRQTVSNTESVTRILLAYLKTKGN